MGGPDVAEECRALPSTQQLDRAVLHTCHSGGRRCADAENVPSVVAVWEAQLEQNLPDVAHELLFYAAEVTKNGPDLLPRAAA